MPPTNGSAAVSEADLVERFRETGQDRYFEALYRRARRRVFGVCLKIVDDIERAEDLCHDAFVRAYQRFGRFEGTAFASWVCRIGVNLSLNEIRHRGVVERAARRSEAPVVPGTAERRLVSREALEAAVEIIGELEPRQREVFLLRHLDEHSYAEIARRTGLRGEQVRSSLQNARRNFRLAWQRREAREGSNDG